VPLQESKIIDVARIDRIGKKYATGIEIDARWRFKPGLAVLRPQRPAGAAAWPLTGTPAPSDGVASPQKAS
jgi:hypothetical protein